MKKQRRQLKIISKRHGREGRKVAKPTKAATPVQSWRMLPTVAIVPSATNPRKFFDAGELDGLAASIRAHGVLEPILVRPHPRRKDRYELVAGERRWRATKLAKLKNIPALVAPYSDDDVLEIQVIENDQRADVSPMERARGYQAMVERGRSAAEIAAKVGRSTRTIYAILSLARMPAALAEAVELGRVPVTTAAVVCRLPNDELRQRAAECVLRGIHDPRMLAKTKTSAEVEPLDRRAAEQLLREHFTVELKNAPFPVEDRDLVPEAGACPRCPKRVGTDRDTHPDGRGDVCTDPACYRHKVDAYRDRQGRIALELAQDNAKTFLSLAETAAMFVAGDLVDRAWCDLAEHCDALANKRTWCDELSPRLNVPRSDALKQYLAVDDRGAMHTLVRRYEAMAALRDLGLIEAPQPRAAVAGDVDDYDVELRAIVIAGDAIAAKARQASPAMGAFTGSGLTAATMAVREFLEHLARCAIDRLATGCQTDLVLDLTQGRVEPCDAAPQAGRRYRSGQGSVVLQLDNWIARSSTTELLAFVAKANAAEAVASNLDCRDQFLAWAKLSWLDAKRQARQQLAGGSQ